MSLGMQIATTIVADILMFAGGFCFGKAYQFRKLAEECDKANKALAEAIALRKYQQAMVDDLKNRFN